MLREKEIELRIVEDSIMRQHEDNLQDLVQNQQFLIESMDESIKMTSQMKLQREQQYLIAQMHDRVRIKQEAARRAILMSCEIARHNFLCEKDAELSKQNVIME